MKKLYLEVKLRQLRSLQAQQLVAVKKEDFDVLAIAPWAGRLYQYGVRA